MYIQGDFFTYPFTSLQWFSFYNSDGDLLTLHQQPIYTEDWIGLKYLDENDKLEFKDCEGAHVSGILNFFLR